MRVGELRVLPPLVLACPNTYRRRRYRLRPQSPLASLSPDCVPGVSVLRPLKGLDPNLFENLESTFTQEYPKFEILLSVASENDQALNVVKELLQKFPSVNAEVVVGQHTLKKRAATS